MELADTEGPTQITLDAVAAHAGISKGGLLHHFNSKDALLTAMVGEVIKGFDDNLQTRSSRGNSAALANLSTHVRRSFAGSGRRSGMALLAVGAIQPALLAPVRSYMRERTQAVARTAARPAEALAAMLIADAVYLCDALVSPVISGALRSEVRALALRLLEESATTAVPEPALPPAPGPIET